MSDEWDDQLGAVERGTAGVHGGAQVQDLAAELRWIHRMEAPERREARLARRGTARNFAAALRDVVPSGAPGRSMCLTINGEPISVVIEAARLESQPLPPAPSLHYTDVATEVVCRATLEVLDMVPGFVLNRLGLRKANPAPRGPAQRKRRAT